MPITGFPIIVGGGGSSETDAVTSITKQPSGAVIVARNNGQPNQDFQLDTAITDVELDLDGDVIANFSNGVASETLFTLPNSIEDLSVTGNTLSVSKAFTGNYDLTLPKEVIDFTTGLTTIVGFYYSFDGHLWKCDTVHTTTATFDYTKFTLQGDSYTTTVNNTVSYTIPVLKQGAKIYIRLTNMPATLTIDWNNFKKNQYGEIHYINGAFSALNLAFTHATLSIYGTVLPVGIQTNQMWSNSDIMNVIVMTAPVSSQMRLDYKTPLANTTLFANRGSSGALTKWNVASVNPSVNGTYNISLLEGDIALDAIPLTNLRSGTPNYSGRSGIVAGTTNSVSGVSSGAILAGQNNTIGGTGRVALTGRQAASTQNTPYSYRESGYASLVSPFYGFGSDISVLQRIMSNTSTLYLTIESGTLKKTLGTFTSRHSKGVHHVTLIGESDSDIFVRKFTVVYSLFNSVYTLLDHTVEYQYQTLGAVGWSYDVSDVTDNILRITPTGGDFWYARINSIYNNR